MKPCTCRSPRTSEYNFVLNGKFSEKGSGRPDRSLPKRDEAEKHFFAEGIWRKLPESILGIATLRARLSELLLAQAAAESSIVIEEIAIKSTACRTQLQRWPTCMDLIAARVAGIKTAFLDLEKHDHATEVFGELDLYAGSTKELLQNLKKAR